MKGSQLGPYGFGYAGPDAPFGDRLQPLGPDYQLYRIGFQERTRVRTFTIDNRVDGNLQCKSNSPAPKGARNKVKGNKEDQCRRF